MPGNNHLLVLSHDPQLKWWSPVARVLAGRLETEAVAWAMGEHDRQLAESTGCYARVVDLLEGLDASRADAELHKNLDRVRRHEQQAGIQCFHEDVAVDRHVARSGWRLARIAHFSAHIMRGIDRQLEQHGPPSAIMGEANTLPYRIVYRMLGSELFYFHPALERTWPHRFSVDKSITSLRLENQQKYEEFLEQGIPEELELIARKWLDEFRAKAVRPLYSRIGAHAKASGTDPLLTKLQPRRAAGAASRWLHRLVDGDPNDPRGVYSSGPGTKLLDTAQEYRNKRAFHEVARPPATDGVEFCTYFTHVEPENAVEGLSFEFRNQLAVIQNIAAMLPGDMRLYVKEHRPMIGVRRRDFFEALKVVPNIRLLTDDLETHQIIRDSRVVFSLTGTCALESMFYGVPTVLLGRIYFQSFRGVYAVRSPDELRQVIHQIFTTDGAGASDQQAVTAMASLYASSYPGKICGVYSVEEMIEPENLELVADGIMAAFKSRGIG